jgi:hypothetical protein
MSEFTREDLLKWYRARDFICSINNVGVNVNYDGNGLRMDAIELASQSNHPDAKWFLSWAGTGEDSTYRNFESLWTEDTLRAKTFRGHDERWMLRSRQY